MNEFAMKNIIWQKLLSIVFIYLSSLSLTRGLLGRKLSASCSSWNKAKKKKKKVENSRLQKFSV
jgi:hypothetical protein